MRAAEAPGSFGIDLGFSLLWPRGRKKTAPLPAQTCEDLGLEALVDRFVVEPRRRDPIRQVFTNLCGDLDTILSRLDVIDDLLEWGQLFESLKELLPVVTSLQYFAYRPDRDDWTPLQEVVWRLRELEHYVRAVGILAAALRKSGARPASRGLKSLAGLVRRIEADPTFRRLVEALPGLLKKIEGLKSVTIGVNLTGGLVPCEATLLAVNDREYAGNTLFSRLTGKEEWRGIAPLHTSRDSEYYANPLMVPLFRDLSRIMDSATRPLAQALKRFVGINSRVFIKLKDDLLFYVGAVEMIHTVRAAGLPMVRPALAPGGERRFQARGLYNLALALQLGGQGEAGGSRPLSERIVASDLVLDQAGRIAILTGPNRGGKTTFLQAVGLAQILAQAGMYAPAAEALVSPCDTVLTHYPAREDPQRGTGRFGEEAERLRALFGRATRETLILLNESLSSTSIGESLYLARDLMGVLRMVGARVLFATHMHQLAAEVDRINAEFPGESLLVSLVATIEPEAGHGIRPTFRIVPGEPAGRSYALDLAARFGVGREQLLAALRERGVLPPQAAERAAREP